MSARSGPPLGPRGVVGAEAEDAVVEYLCGLGWSVLARNVRVGRDELDVVAVEPGEPDWLVVVEVRSASTPRFGSPRESVGAGKVARLYRAGLAMRRLGYPGLGLAGSMPRWRVDLITLVRQGRGRWVLEAHLRGLDTP
jgi:putative endonuclease